MLIAGIILIILAMLCIALCIVALTDYDNNLAPMASNGFGAVGALLGFFGIWLIVMWVKEGKNK